ncbi:MAG: aminopeptidase [Clostridia bacterium]|nr:aminopeptidase [Clostridia bacterium]
MEKSEGKVLEEKLLNNKKSGWERITDKEKENIFKFSDEYIWFLNRSKTEREFVKTAVDILEKNGFRDVNSVDNIKTGDKVYFSNRGKSLYIAVIGAKKLEEGLNLVGAHIDSPRLDLKPNALYEDTEFAYFNTHYYGGIKKYQWTAIPLSIHGVIVKSNGEKIDVNIGEDEEDPIFTITDLLPHLAKDQLQKKLNDGIEGEDLNLLIGNMPINYPEVKEKVKLNVLKILNEKYGITEADFLSSELELVPAFNAKSLGFDRSMIAGYGHDDKVCAYTALRAILEAQNIEKTSVCILSDKEEVGSMGNTGMESQTFDYFISELLNKSGENRPNLLNKVFCNSSMLSADVGVSYDPIYGAVSDRTNCAYSSYGISFDKYTGSRGKAGGSDANAEFIAKLRGILEKHGIQYQIAELGKVDVGGGGTIAYILANKGVEVIDCGVPVLSMHSPYEVASKYDIYSAYKTYKIFYEEA